MINQNNKNVKQEEVSIDDELNALFEKLNKPEQFDDKVYKLLPKFLSELTTLFIDRQEKDSALFCSLCLLSGAMPNYTVVYDGDILEANIFGYVYGTSGVGKGVLRKCMKLLEPIHKQKTERATKAMQEYDKAQQSKKRSKKRNRILDEDAKCDNNKIKTVDEEEYLEMPRDERLYIPANSTKASMFKLLLENGERGVICESETATLLTALKQEHGAFKDMLLASFHHESFSVSRKSERTIEIENPCISILLSSTLKHISLLFGTGEDGLYSRFIFHRVYAKPEFRSPFDDTKANINRDLLIKAKTVKKLYNQLEKLKDAPISFRFNKEQQTVLAKKFQAYKDEHRKVFGDGWDGVTHRYSLILTRIAMVLSMYRVFYTGKPNPKINEDEIVCTNRDFECSSLIVDKLFDESLLVYELINRGNKDFQSTKDEAKGAQKAILIKRCVELYLAKYTYREISKEVLGDSNKQSTVFKWLKKEGVNKK